VRYVSQFRHEETSP